MVVRWYIYTYIYTPKKKSETTYPGLTLRIFRIILTKERCSWVAFARPSYLWAVLPGVPWHWRFPPASGGHPPRLIPSSGGLGLLPGAWGAPKRGMPTGPKVFLALPDACGLRPCDRAHIKNGLVPYSCVGGTQR